MFVKRELATPSPGAEHSLDLPSAAKLDAKKGNMGLRDPEKGSVLAERQGPASLVLGAPSGHPRDTLGTAGQKVS